MDETPDFKVIDTLIKSLNEQLVERVDNWLFINGVTKTNFNIFELIYNPVKMQYILKKHGEVVSTLDLDL